MYYTENNLHKVRIMLQLLIMIGSKKGGGAYVTICKQPNVLHEKYVYIYTCLFLSLMLME